MTCDEQSVINSYPQLEVCNDVECTSLNYASVYDVIYSVNYTFQWMTSAGDKFYKFKKKINEIKKKKRSKL